MQTEIEENNNPVAIDTATGKAAAPELSSERVKDIFSSIAKRYGVFNAVSSFGAYRLWLERMVEMADIENCDTVLDIAGGTGDVSFCVAKRKHPASIYCTDLVSEMLQVAESRYTQNLDLNTPITFEVVDAQEMPYDDASFDAVCMAYGLRNMPKREVALSEVHRVLKPGGSFTCLDFSTPKNPIWRCLYNFYLNHMIPFWGKLITGDASGFRYLASSIKAFPNQQGVADMMTNAGFDDVKWKNCTGGIACIHTARKTDER